MAANPHIHSSTKNPNEPHGYRACAFAGQQKHPDCSGDWNTIVGMRVYSPAPLVAFCDAHLLELATAKGFVTPKVTERRPKRAARREHAELSL